MRLGLMVSGDLGLQMLRHCVSNYHVFAIMTDRHSLDIQRLAVSSKVPLFIGNPRDNRAKEFIASNTVDILLSINYLFIVELDIISWPVKGAVNFHGSLLPKYRGRTPHVWAIINNEQKTGVTAHLLSEGCDEGSIIRQIEVPIDLNDSGQTLLKKYSAVYPQIIDDVIVKFNCGEVIVEPQNHQNSSFFGKRTPEDGKIVWDWQKERIYNWVRAQSNPYPGAFSLVDGQKVIIDWLEYDDFGFNQYQPNGLIVTVDPVRVKTPNGVVRLSKIRQGKSFIKQGKVLV